MRDKEDEEESLQVPSGAREGELHYEVVLIDMISETAPEHVSVCCFSK